MVVFNPGHRYSEHGDYLYPLLDGNVCFSERSTGCLQLDLCPVMVSLLREDISCERFPSLSQFMTTKVSCQLRSPRDQSQLIGNFCFFDLP